MAPTHPRHTTTNNDGIMFLEPLIYNVPGQATSDYGSARCWIVGHLGELAGVDQDSLCGREPGIRGVTTTLHLKRRRVERVESGI